MLPMETKVVLDGAAMITAVLTGVAAVMSAAALAMARKAKAETEAAAAVAEARKTIADAESVSVNAAGDVVEMLREEVNSLRSRVDLLEAQVKIERRTAEEAQSRYAVALNRIVDLEALTATLNREAAQLRLELAKYKQVAGGEYAKAS
jgi:uncharacterized coiled-coil DUF342 family protein